jgi:hypothetical protein
MTDLDQLRKISIADLSRTSIPQRELLGSIEPVDTPTGKQTAAATHIIEETCRVVAYWGPINASGTGNGVWLSEVGVQLYHYLGDKMWEALISELQLKHPEHVDHFTHLARQWY